VTIDRLDGPQGGPRFAFPDGELDDALFIGAVTDRSVRAWMRRPAGPATVRLAVDGGDPVEAELHPDPSHDFVGSVRLELAEPQPDARFRVTVDGAIRSGRLAPAPDARSAFSFAFGSCHQPFTDPPADNRLQRHGGAGIYPRMEGLLRERDARFLLLLGDQVYSDAVSKVSVREVLAKDESLTDEDLLETYRHLYRGYFNERGFRELTESFPAYLMWDDHDIFDGWGSLLHETDFDRRLFRAAEAAFREYQHIRNPGAELDGPPPYAYGFWHGDVGFFVLDLRSERDYEQGRILGPAQWSQFDEFLREATKRDTRTIFVGASVPVVHASPTIMRALEGLPTGTGRDIRDRWDVPNFGHERTTLLERLFGWQAAAPGRQAIILSGDVHVAAAFSLRPRRGRGHLAQWTSSALSTPGGLQHVLANRLVTSLVRLGEDELRVWRRGLATGNNMGVVDVVPRAAGGHDVTFTVYQYDQRADRLTAALTDHAGPG
jgi:phosphodiesterase/alkaline phosphatase D-like protein